MAAVIGGRHVSVATLTHQNRLITMPHVLLRRSYGYAPLIAVLILLAAGAADGNTLKLGIMGDKYLKPYGIIILFMSQVGAEGSTTAMVAMRVEVADATLSQSLTKA